MPALSQSSANGLETASSARIMIVAGEASGDLHGASLARAILQMVPTVDLFGVGGDNMQSAGVELIHHINRLAVMGITEVLGHLGEVRTTLDSLTTVARERDVDAVVLIDYPDFNLTLARRLRKHIPDVPIIYYISPQVWAWRRGRLRTMKRFVTRALVIFPFEEALYREADIPVAFVGHPLLDLATPALGRDAFRRAYRLDPEAPTVAVLPGSRANELRMILPDLVGAVERIARAVPSVQFVIARAPNLPDALFEPLARLTRVTSRVPCIVESQTDAVLVAADVVLTASGTATIQAAIHERPMVVVYRLSALTYWMGRRFVRVNAFGMVNLVAEKSIVPEFLQEAFTPEAVAGEAVRFLTDETHAATTRAELRTVREKLGGSGASRRAAEQVLDVVRAHRAS